MLKVFLSKCPWKNTDFRSENEKLVILSLSRNVNSNNDILCYYALLCIISINQYFY